MHSTSTLDFVELDLLEAPDDGWDWLRGFGYGVAHFQPPRRSCRRRSRSFRPDAPEEVTHVQ